MTRDEAVEYLIERSHAQDERLKDLEGQINGVMQVVNWFIFALDKFNSADLEVARSGLEHCIVNLKEKFGDTDAMVNGCIRVIRSHLDREKAHGPTLVVIDGGKQDA